MKFPLTVYYGKIGKVDVKYFTVSDNLHDELTFKFLVWFFTILQSGLSIHVFVHGDEYDD